MCGSLRLSDAGKRATIMGWVNKRRDLGNIGSDELPDAQREDGEETPAQEFLFLSNVDSL